MVGGSACLDSTSMENTDDVLHKSNLQDSEDEKQIMESEKAWS